MPALSRSAGSRNVGRSHLHALAAGIATTRDELGKPAYALPGATIERTARLQLHMVEGAASLLGGRAASGRIVEGHGDLRPEHVCMTSPPRIIDCLEFSRELRSLDAVDELAYLALECERLGAPELRDRIFDGYRRLCDDDPPASLIDFYQSYRASIRAKIAIWHLRDPALQHMPKWRMQALDYLRLAAAHAERCAQPAAPPLQPPPSSTSDPPR